MKYANIKLSKEELLKTVTLMERDRQVYEETLCSEDCEIYQIAKEWLEDINAVIEKMNKALDEFYKAPF